MNRDKYVLSHPKRFSAVNVVILTYAHSVSKQPENVHKTVHLNHVNSASLCADMRSSY